MCCLQPLYEHADAAFADLARLVDAGYEIAFTRCPSGYLASATRGSDDHTAIADTLSAALLGAVASACEIALWSACRS